MNSELARRIAFTLGALLIYRIGAYIPLPGTDAFAWGRITGAHTYGIFGPYDMPAAGAARHLAIFALGILPYITAAILVQLVAIGSSRLRALSAGDRGRVKIAGLTLCLTIVLAAFQAYGLAHGLQGLPSLVAQPGPIFVLTTVLSLTAGTMLLVWLANQITAHGIGNGLVLILAVNLVVELPATIAVVAEQVRQGYISMDLAVVGTILAVVVTVLIACVEGARRNVVVDFPQQTIGGRTLASRSANLTLKVNSAGLIPTVIAGWLIVIVIFGILVGVGVETSFVRQLGHGHPLFMVLFSALIVLLALFYTAFLIDPDEASERLKTHGGTVRGVAAGEPTAVYLDTVISRITLIGAVYLACIFVLPEILIVYFGLPFFLGGAPFLIVVCAALDIGAQVKQHAQLKSGS